VTEEEEAEEEEVCSRMECEGDFTIGTAECRTVFWTSREEEDFELGEVVADSLEDGGDFIKESDDFLCMSDDPSRRREGGLGEEGRKLEGDFMNEREVLFFSSGTRASDTSRRREGGLEVAGGRIGDEGDFIKEREVFFWRSNEEEEENEGRCAPVAWPRGILRVATVR
jgi:hypothetical protein